METLLHDNSLPEDIKVNRVSDTLRDFSVYADKIMLPQQKPSAVTPVVQNSYFDALPKTFQNSAKHLVKELERYSHNISWNSDNKEVIIDGKTLPGSNIVDLTGDVLRNRKTVPSRYIFNAKQLRNFNSNV